MHSLHNHVSTAMDMTADHIGDTGTFHYLPKVNPISLIKPKIPGDPVHVLIEIRFVHPVGK